MPCTLATRYAPNHDQASFIAATLKKLGDFARGCIVLAGDFNTPLEPLQDTSQGSSCISHRRLAFIRRCLHEAQLMDIWRVVHPRMRDYTHYSHLHHAYSRIDYFFIDHHHFPLLLDTGIETSTFSDHAPITLKLKIPNLPQKTTNWKLNDHLILEDIDRKIIEGVLNHYFKENTHPDLGGP